MTSTSCRHPQPPIQALFNNTLAQAPGRKTAGQNFPSFANLAGSF
ncbi:hypothetical protein [Fibrivirga algicola]|nr:hypothetical protein [Fibrivirga algicola]